MADESKKPSLDFKELQFVKHYAAGKTAVDAAIAAGYAESTARKKAYEILKRPAVIDELDRVREQIRADAEYDLEAAVAECDAVIAECRQFKQMTAAAKMIELKTKLYGLLVERFAHFVGKIDLKEVIAQRDAKLLEMRSPPLPALELAADDPVPTPAADAEFAEAQKPRALVQQPAEQKREQFAPIPNYDPLYETRRRMDREQRARQSEDPLQIFSD